MMTQEKVEEAMNDIPKKIKLLWYSDFLIPTGFGNVAEEIVSRLHSTGKYEIEVVGINYDGNPYNIPGTTYFHLKDIPVYPAIQVNKIAAKGVDMFGKEVFVNLMRTGNYDIVFALQDAFNMTELKDAIEDLRETYGFKYVLYFPVDGDIEKSWVDNAIKVADYPITYTMFGEKEVSRHSEEPVENLDFMYHGADITVYKPFANNEDRNVFRKAFFQVEDQNTIIITNVNRNQPRKDLVRSLLAFQQFKKDNPNSIMYLHCNVSDRSGIDIKKWILKYLDEDIRQSIIYPNMNMIGSRGLPKEIMAGIYAGSDMVISTSLGEGWGLSTTEAMACQVPVVVPDNSANTEIIGKDENENGIRGYLAECGVTPSDFFVQKFDNECMRPLTDIDSLVDNMNDIVRHPNEAKEKARRAKEWLQNYTWDKMAEKWDKLLSQVYEAKLLSDKQRILAETERAEKEAANDVVADEN